MTEWYRTPDWDREAQADFEQRLSRARGQQSEYLRSKAMALHHAGLLDEAAGLYERFLTEHPDSITSYVQEMLGDVARGQGRLEEAERRYRNLLARRPLPASSGMVEVSLAEVLFEQGKLDEAEAALAEVNVDDVATFNSKFFRYLVASARIAHARGDVDRAASAAADALNLVDAPPPFYRHPTVGLVKTDAATLDMLRALVGAGR